MNFWERFDIMMAGFLAKKAQSLRDRAKVAGPGFKAKVYLSAAENLEEQALAIDPANDDPFEPADA